MLENDAHKQSIDNDYDVLPQGVGAGGPNISPKLLKILYMYPRVKS